MSFRNNFLFRRAKDLIQKGKGTDEESAVEPSRRLAVVVTEDPAELETLSRALISLDLEVQPLLIQNAELEALAEMNPDLVLAQLTDTSVGGYSHYQRLVERRAENPPAFLFITEAGKTPDQVVGHQSFACDYIQRPVSPAELKSRVQSVLRAAVPATTPQAQAPAPKPPLDFPDPLPASIQQRGAPAPESGQTKKQSNTQKTDSKQPTSGNAAAKNAPSSGKAQSGASIESLEALLEGISSLLPEEKARLGVAAETGPSGEEIQERPASEIDRQKDLVPPGEGPNPASSGMRQDAPLQESSEPAEKLPEEFGFRRQFGQHSCTTEQEDEEPYQEFEAVEEPEAGSSAPDYSKTPFREAHVAATRSEVVEESGSAVRETDNVGPELKPAGSAREPSFAEILAQDELLSFAFRPDLKAEEEALKQGTLTFSSLYEKARRTVLELFRKADRGETPDPTNVGRLVDEILPAVESGPALLLAATDREQKFSVVSHSVNVAVLALRIAHTLQFPRESQRQIVLAALLHEIGTVRLPLHRNQGNQGSDGIGSDDGRSRVLYSAELLEQWGSPFRSVAGIVRQIQERENEFGYPAGLTGQELCEEARIIRIADLFEAAIHVRPHRQAVTGYQALFELTTDRSSTFSNRILKSLIKSFSLYPYNETVLLNSGEVGRVVDIHRDNLSRPVVQLLYDAQQHPLAEPKILDLTRCTTLYVVRSIDSRLGLAPECDGVPDGSRTVGRFGSALSGSAAEPLRHRE